MKRYDALPVRLLETARAFPEKTAYIYGGEKLSYGELSEKVRSLAAYLAGGSSPVIIYGHKSPMFITAVFACLFTGRAYVPCDVYFPPERVRKTAALSGAKTVICTENETVECENALTVSRSALMSILSEKAELSPAGSGDENAYIIFTSGSTGVPKGIPVRRESLDNFVGFSGKYLKGGEHLGHALFSFDLSVADIFTVILSGGTLIETDGPVTGNFTEMVCTPTFLRLCLLGKAFTRENLPRLERVLCCGEVLPVTTAKKLLSRFNGIKLINAYGPAEACCFVSAHTVTAHDTEEGCIPIGDEGEYSCGLEIREGEIFLKGKAVSRGYLTDETGGFRDGGYYTGDKGEIKNRLLYFGGRKYGRTVKYSGYRIEPSEIEEELLKQEGITDCLCVPVFSENGQADMIKAMAVSDKDFDERELKRALSKVLPPYMIPKSIVRVSAIPATPNGKTISG